jgi:hypothetical protein
MSTLRVVIASAVLLIGKGAAADTSGDNGILLGATRIHPSVQFDAHYALNPARRPTALDPHNDMYLVVRPGLDAQWLGSKNDVVLKSTFEYQRYLGIEDSSTSKLSNYEATVDGQGVFNRDGHLELRLSEVFRRSADPENYAETRRFLHNLTVSGIGVDVKPGGGALIFKLDYQFYYDRYDRSSQTGVFSADVLDNMRHMPRFYALWKFLPKTALFVGAEAQITRYNRVFLPGTTIRNTDENIVEVFTGLKGSITPRIDATLKIGYGDTFSTNHDNFRSVIGQMEAGYNMSEVSRVQVGLLRTVQGTTMFQYVGILRAYADLTQELAGRWLLNGHVAYDDLRYGRPLAGPLENRVDGNLRLEAAVGYRIFSWFTATAGNAFGILMSNYRDASGMDVSYRTNDTFIRLEFRY